MPRVRWPLRNGRPCLEIVLTLVADGKPFPRMVLADTGAGSRNSGIDLILPEDDCLLCGGLAGVSVRLRGGFSGSYPLYDLLVQVPALGFAKHLRVVGVPAITAAFDGIACFCFLSRFTYGNFGNTADFGLEQ